MSGESSVGGSVSFAEHEVLKGKHEALLREHEASILAIEVLEKKLREAVVAKEEDEYWKKKYLELEKKLESVEKDIEELMMSSEVTGEEDSGTATTLGEDGKVVIEISDDDEGNRSESSGGESDTENREKLSFYL